MAKFFKDDQNRTRKIDDDSGITADNLDLESKGESAEKLVDKVKADDIKSLKSIATEAKEHDLDDSVIVKLKELEGDDVSIEDVEGDGSPFSHGDLIKLDNGAEYLIFDDNDAMVKEAHDQLENDWENEPEIFGNVPEEYQSVNDTNAHLLAIDFASSRLDGVEDDVAKEIEDTVRDKLVDKEDDDNFEDLVNDEVQKRLPKELEKREEDLTDEIEEEIKSDFKHFIVQQEGLVNEEDFQKQYSQWMHTNVEEMIDDIISSDGAENTISRIDGDSHEVGNGKLLVKESD